MNTKNNPDERAVIAVSEERERIGDIETKTKTSITATEVEDG